MDTTKLRPKPPPGFILDEPNRPKPPAGFVLDENLKISGGGFGTLGPPEPFYKPSQPVKTPDISKLPEGFVLDESKIFFDSPESLKRRLQGLRMSRREQKELLRVDLGAPLGPVGIIGGAVVGAGIGGAGGRGYQQAYEMMRPAARQKPLTDIYTDQIINGLEQSAWELAGRGIAKGVGWGLRTLGKAIAKPGAKETAEVLLKKGVPPTLAQLTRNRIVDMLENITEGSFLGGRLQKLKTITQPAAITRAVNELSENYAKGLGAKLTSEEIGDLVLDTINQKETAFKAASRSVYRQVDKLIQKGGRNADIVDLTQLKRFASKTAASKLTINRSLMGDTLLDNISKLPDTVNFHQATSLRSSLLTQARTMGANKDVALGIAKQLTKMTDGAIEKSTAQLPADALRMWRFANKFYREGKGTFTSRIISTLSNKLAENPEMVVNKIFVPNASKQIRLVKNTVGPETWRMLQYGYVRRIIEKSTSETGEFGGKRFMHQLNSLGDSALRESFNASQIKEMKDLAMATIATQAPTQPFAATGRIIVAMGQAGAIWRWGPQGATFIIAPPLLARVFSNPVWAKMVTGAIKDPVKSSAAMVRLTALLNKSYQQEKQQVPESTPIGEQMLIKPPETIPIKEQQRFYNPQAQPKDRQMELMLKSH